MRLEENLESSPKGSEVTPPGMMLLIIGCLMVTVSSRAQQVLANLEEAIGFLDEQG